MLDRVAQAIKQQDYKTAAKLLKPLIEKDGKNLWVQFYAGRVQEGLGKGEAAEKIYLRLLPQTQNPKLIAQIRQGIARLDNAARSRQEQAIANALNSAGGEDLGVLILEPIASEAKLEAARAFGQIMNLDAYTARLQLPGRGWRLYRSGKMGELQYYVSRLKAVNIPSFCLALHKIEEIRVFEVHYFNTLTPQIVARCKNQDGQEGSLSFDPSEITQCVFGRVPLFASVVDFDARRKLQRKTQKQDTVPFCDLHLPQRKCILRLSERHYRFQQGITLENKPPSLPAGERETVSKNWDYLMEFLQEFLQDIPKRSDFEIFADTAIDFRETLSRIDPHINLDRRQPSLWDSVFHLYSGLIFWRDRSPVSLR